VHQTPDSELPANLRHCRGPAGYRGACLRQKKPNDAQGRPGPGGTAGKGDRTTTRLAKLRRKLLTDPRVQAAYDRLGPIFAVVGEMVDARLAAGLTQADIAVRMGISQSVVARLESARHMPTFDMVTRYAGAIGRRIDIHLVPAGSGRAVLGNA
jgi:ribosome-binding protein aMBF1 (putative translation factor)